MILDRSKSPYTHYALDLAGIESRYIQKDSKSPSSLSHLDLAGIQLYKKKDIESARADFKKIRSLSSIDPLASKDPFSTFSIKRTDRKTLMEKNLQIIEISKKSVRPQDLYIPFPEFKKIDPSKCCPGSCEEVKALIESTVEEVLDQLDYNGLISLSELLKHLNSHVGQKECLSLYKFTISCREEAETFKSGDCVGLSWAVLKKIQEKFGIEGELFVEKGGLFNSFFHAACGFRCRDGWILIEAGWEKGQRVQAIPFGVSKMTSSGLILEATDLPSSCLTPILRINASSKEKSGHYYNTIANVDTLIMSRFCLRGHYIPAVAYENGTPVVAVKVCLKTKTVALQIKISAKTISMKFSTQEINFDFKDKLQKITEGKCKISVDDLYLQIQTIISLSEHYYRLQQQLKIS